MYLYEARGGCRKTVWEVASANTISAKLKGVSIKLTECGLNYILILIKFKGFLIKLARLMDNPSHPCTIWRQRNSVWRGSNCISIKLEGVAVKFLRGGLSKCYFYKVKGGFYKINWVWLDYILILMKFEDFFIKLPSLLNNPSHPCFRSFKDVTNNQPQPCLLYNAEFM